MYTRILVALWLIAAGPVTAYAQSDPETPRGAPPPIAALQEELRQAGFDPGPANGVMTEQTTRALIAYERRMRRMPQAIASVGVDAADPVMRAQKELKRLGFYSGRPDGELGPGTRDAITPGSSPASAIIATDLVKLSAVLERRAWEFKDTPMIGRTHGIHAEPITFGFKLANWYSETQRNIVRFRAAAARAPVRSIMFPPDRRVVYGRAPLPRCWDNAGGL